MFTDFDKIFNGDKNREFKVPEKYLNYLSKQLPDGMSYNSDGKGNCFISSEGQQYTIGGLKFKLTKEQKKIIKSDRPDDIMKYSYNSQECIEIVPVNGNKVILNGSEISIEKISFNFFSRNDSGKFFMIPPKFDFNINFCLSDEEYSRELNVVRVPNKSIDVETYESNIAESLSINFSYNTTTSKLTFNVKYNIVNAKSISDIIESVSLYNSLIEGKATIQGYPLGKVSAKKYNEVSVDFWKKMVELEKILHISFDTPKQNLEDVDIYVVEELYRSLVLKLPFRDRIKINDIDAEGEFDESIYDLIGKELFFKFNSTFKYELLGRCIELPYISLVFNSKLKDIKSNGKTYKLFFENSDDKSKIRYISKMYFLTNNELNEFNKTIESSIPDEFTNTKYIFEYE